MRESSWWDQLSMALRGQGCPARTTTRVLQEIEDHHADLKTEGLERGWDEEQSEAYARQRLGSPDQLAQRFIRMRRHTDWWGRHPKLLFGLAPLVVFVLSFAGATLFLALLGNFYGWWDRPSTLSDDTWMMLTMMVPLFHFALVMVIPMLVCRLANYYCYGWRWALVACLVLAIHAYLHSLVITFPLFGDHGHISWGYGFSSQPNRNLWTAMPPLLVFAVYYLETFRLRLGAIYDNKHHDQPHPPSLGRPMSGQL